MKKFVLYLSILLISMQNLRAEVSLEEKAYAGDADAMYELSLQRKRIPLNSSVVHSSNDDNDSAFYWAKKAYDNGSLEATERLACFYEKGIGTPRDLDKALELYTKAVENGNLNAMARLAIFHSTKGKKSKYTDIDKAKSLVADLLKRLDSEKEVDIELRLFLIKTYLEGKLCEKNMDKAVAQISELLEMDKPEDFPHSNFYTSEARDAMIFCYIRGIGVEKDLDKAKALYRIGAKVYNNAPLDFREYELGLFVPNSAEDYKNLAKAYMTSSYGDFEVLYEDKNEKAKYFFEKSADMGCNLAIFALGHFYEKDKNYEKALELYEKACESIGKTTNYEEVQAILNLANIYRNGKITEKNIDKAIELYEKISDNRSAAYQLGFIYYEQGNFDKALPLLLKAAKNNHSENIFSTIAKCYEEGLGTPKDLNQALKFYELAIKLSSKKDSINAKIKEISELLGVEFEESPTENKVPLEQRAIAGDVDAMYELAKKNLSLGINGASSRGSATYSSSFYWYSKAYENGKLEAISDLGRCYELGIGTKKDKDKAIELYKEAWGKGDIYGLVRLINATEVMYMLTNRDIPNTSPKKIYSDNFLALVKIAKERDDLDSEIYDFIARKCLHQKDSEAIYFLKKFIETKKTDTFNSSNEASSYLALAYCYATATLTEKDEEKAKELLNRVKEKVPFIKQEYIFVAYLLGIYELKTAEDFYSIGIIYDSHCGTYNSILFETNKEKAIEFYEKAVEMGSIDAKPRLANLYTQTNPQKALELNLEILNSPIKRANVFQFGQSALYVANVYETGKIVEKDIEKALEYYQKAADSNDSIAKLTLAEFYFNGKYVEQDYTKALSYLKELENVYAYARLYEMLGEIYEKGLGGVEKDSEKAIQYYKTMLKYTSEMSENYKEIQKHIEELEEKNKNF